MLSPPHPFLLLQLSPKSNCQKSHLLACSIYLHCWYVASGHARGRCTKLSSILYSDERNLSFIVDSTLRSTPTTQQSTGHSGVEGKTWRGQGVKQTYREALTISTSWPTTMEIFLGHGSFVRCRCRYMLAPVQISKSAPVVVAVSDCCCRVTLGRHGKEARVTHRQIGHSHPTNGSHVCFSLAVFEAKMPFTSQQLVSTIATPSQTRS